MALPIRPNNPNIPIPNTTFSSPLNAYVNGPYFPVVMGTGIDITTPGKVADLNNAGLLEFNGAVGDVNLVAGPGIAVTEVDNDFTIDNTGVISLIAGTNIQISGSNGTYTISSTDAQTGTVTSVGTGVGLTGGPITTSGTISLDVSGVTPGSYTYSDLTVDAYGRITMVSNGVAPVTTVTGTAPVQVTGTAPSLTVAVAPSSTTAPGVVQLVDALNSTSTTQALTAAQGKVLQDQISALAAASNLTFAGTIDGATGLMVSVSTEAAGLTTPFVVGQAMPAAAAENEDYFTIVSAAGTMTPPGGSSTVTTVGDWFLSTGATYQFLDTGFNPPYASTTEAGIVELADNAETQAGTDATLAVTAAGLQSKVSDSVSTASSTSIASSQAVKDAYDAATAAQTDATQALSDAAAAQATADAALPLSGGTMTGVINFAPGQTVPVGSIQDGTLTQKGVVQLEDSVSSTSTTTAATPNSVKQAYDAAAAAQVDATQALSDASSAQTDATQALSDAASAQTDATQALADAAAAQTDATQALADAAAAGADVGDLSTLTTTDKSSAVAAINEVNAAASNAQTDATQALADASAAQGDATQALADAAAAGADVGDLSTLTTTDKSSAVAAINEVNAAASNAQTDATQALADASAAQADATQALADAAAAQSTADAAIPCAALLAKGNLIGASGAGTPVALSVGTDGQVLAANSACSEGLEWITAGGGSGASPATPTVAGILEGYSCGVDANISVGYGSLAAIDPASGGCINTSLGVNALSSLTFGARNIAIGHEALCTATNTYSNVAIGACALQNTTLSNNVAIGDLAGYAITTGNANVAIGTRAMVNATTPSISVAIGCRAMQCASGSGNVGIGMTALCKVSGSYNVGLGTSTGQNITTGAGNTFLGALTGGFTNTGSCNVFIGFGTGPLANTDCCLWMGLDTAVTWLTGDGTSAIKPGAGIIDCAGSCGTAGQVLSSNGSNAIEWIAAGGGGGGSPATPSTEGTVYAYTDLYDQATPAGGNATLGNGAGAALTSTDLHNTIVGSFAGGSLTGVTGQTALGFGALAQATTPTTPSEVNVALGYLSGMSVTTGGNNILIGQQAGLNYTTESGNIIIGNTAGGAAADAGIIRIGHGSQQAYIELDAGGAIDISGSTAGTAGQVLTSAGPNNPPTWATPSGGSSPVVTYNQLINVTASTAASVIGWGAERGTSENYLLSGNVSAMLFITANNGGNGTNVVAWAQIMLNGLGGSSLSQVIASDTTGGTFSIASVIYPAYSDTTVQFTSTTTDSPMLFNISLNWFGGFRYNPTVYGTAAT